MASLMDKQNFESFLTPSVLHEALRNAEAEFIAFEHVRTEKEKMTEVVGYEPLSSTAKGQQTKMLNALDSVLQIHAEQCPDLAEGVLNKKMKPLEFLLASPLTSNLMHSSLGGPILEMDEPKQDNVAVRRKM